MGHVGDRLLDLLPDAEPPLGFDQRVLSAVRPRRRTPRLRVVVMAAAAAAVILVGAVTATVLPGRHHSPHATELSAVLWKGGRTVGSVRIAGQPAWVSMSVAHLSVTGTVSCQLVSRDGTVTDVGTFQLVHGAGSWGAYDPVGPTSVAEARVIGDGGAVLASASFPAR